MINFTIFYKAPRGSLCFHDNLDSQCHQSICRPRPLSEVWKSCAVEPFFCVILFCNRWNFFPLQAGAAFCTAIQADHYKEENEEEESESAECIDPCCGGGVGHHDRSERVLMNISFCFKLRSRHSAGVGGQTVGEGRHRRVRRELLLSEDLRLLHGC